MVAQKQDLEVSSEKNRFQKIADLLSPKGVTTVYGKPPGVRAAFDFRRGVIHAPAPVDDQALWDFSHECAHARLHWDPTAGRMQPDFADRPSHVTQYECERWTFHRFKEAERLSDDMIRQSSEYMMNEIIKDRRVIADRGLYQPALSYLLEDHRNQADRRLEEYMRELTCGLSGRNAIIPYLGKSISEEDLARPLS